MSRAIAIAAESGSSEKEHVFDHFKIISITKIQGKG